METSKPKIKLSFFLLGILAVLGAPPLKAGTLVFSKPQKLAVLPWANNESPGVPPQGPDGLAVDLKGNLILESERVLDFFSPQGRFLKSLHPIDSTQNFYGFASIESLADGKIALLTRLESSLEQRNKDNFEERSRPGAKLVVVSPEGQVSLEKEEVDTKQPHSLYVLQDGVVYSVHEDGAIRVLDRLEGSVPQVKIWEDLVYLSFNPDRWAAHLEKLPVYSAQSRIYHDIKNNPHEDKGAIATLLGRRFIEGTGRLAERRGRIYYQVVCDQGREFSNAVFVEDLHGKNYGLVELVSPDDDLNLSHDHALFVDKKGNLFEGVAKKNGYEIYRWSSFR